MPRPDTGSFNRLLTSVGLLLLAAALVIPYFYFQVNDTLRITRDELAALTTTGRESIEGRQGDIAAVQPYVLPGSAILILAGSSLLVWGGIRLRGAQDRDDREAKARVTMAEAGVRDLTPAEKEEKIAEDATGAQAEAETERTRKPGVADRPSAWQASPGSRLKQTQEQRLEDARRVEGKIGSAFADAKLDHHIFRPQVAVADLKLDGLFISESPSRPDILLEVRVGIPILPQPIADRALARMVHYEAERRRACRPWLVVVVPTQEQDDPNRGAKRIDLNHKRLDNLLKPVGAATVILESEIEKLPKAFEAIGLGEQPDPRGIRITPA
jgi:hypothetical protein